MLLIKNAEVYAPSFLGRKDVLVCNEKIEWIAENISEMPENCRVVDASGLVLAPGVIDQHVHVAGGGGEGGCHTRTPELQLSELIEAGITTVVGLLGTDGMTRSVENLYAKTMALKEEGVSAYMLTGAYGYPGPTITGEADKDIVFIREVIGRKLAISDHRAPNITTKQLIRIASDTRVAGILSGKAGIVVLHMGDAKSGLQPVLRALEESAVPVGIFRPTHMNRNPALIEESFAFLAKGGYVDYTCGLAGQRSPGECILEAERRNLPLHHITVSSDGHGSWSNYAEDGTLLKIGVSGVESMQEELHAMVKKLSIPLERALTYLTENVAKALALYPQKGCIREGADADLLLMSKELELHTVIARGQVMMREGSLQKQGTYEKRI